jgi:hypothetical protein
MLNESFVCHSEAPRRSRDAEESAFSVELGKTQILEQAVSTARGASKN